MAAKQTEPAKVTLHTTAVGLPLAPQARSCILDGDFSEKHIEPHALTYFL